MTFATIDLPFSGKPIVAAYQDGFGIVNVLGTNQWYQSDLFDLSTWQALNFTSADSKPDDVVALLSVQRNVWVLKEFDTEVWTNAGLPGFAFQRLQGVFIEFGCAAPFSASILGEEPIWLARNKEGAGMVVMMQGYSPKRVSTHAIEREIQSYSSIDDAIGFTYQQEGHLFYQLTFPTGDKTWVYDLTTGLWHQRASFENGQFHRHQANAYAFFKGQHVVGDYKSAKLFTFDMDTFTDCCNTKKWVRSWRALPKPTDTPVRFNSLRVDMETGAGVPDGTEPDVVLRWSDDGGHTWSNPRIESAGNTGETARRVMFKRLGSTRRNSGLDRIFELSSTDPFKVALIGGELE